MAEFLCVYVLRDFNVEKKERIDFAGKYPVFPLSEEEREKLVLDIARYLEKRDGRFHAAGVWHELESLYGGSVLKKRIDVEKWISCLFKSHPGICFHGAYGRRKYYCFTD